MSRRTRVLRLLLERRLFRLGQRTGTLVTDNEELAAHYIALSGRKQHTSICATSNAPAYRPGPCDCVIDAPSGNEPFDDPAHFGDMPLVVHSDGGDFIGWVHGEPNK